MKKMVLQHRIQEEIMIGGSSESRNMMDKVRSYVSDVTVTLPQDATEEERKIFAIIFEKGYQEIKKDSSHGKWMVVPKSYLYKEEEQ